MPTQGELLLRLLLAGALAGALGGERELTEQPAGFRTHILVGLGSALFAIISAYGFQAIVAHGPALEVRADVSRVASQIVVGIGFLGGGAILKYGASIRGLTTAASLWVTAAIGTAVGLGALVLGSATTGMTLLALVGLRPLRRTMRRHAIGREEFLIEADRDLDVRIVLDILRSEGGTIEDIRVTEEGDDVLIRLAARLPRDAHPAVIGPRIARIEHVRNVDWAR